ncbi:MAG: STAS domain-containing protein [Roseiflexaceae bacterium]
MLDRFIQWLFPITSNDPVFRRRQQNAILIALGMAFFAIISLPLAMIQSNPLFSIIINGSAIVLFIGMIQLARQGHVVATSLTVMGVLIIGVAGSTPQAITPTILFFICLTVLIASATLRPIAIIPVYIVTIIALWLGLLSPPQSFFATAEGRQTIFNVNVLLPMLTLLGYISSRGVNSMLSQSARSAREATLAQRAQEATNQQLSGRIQARNEELARALSEQQAQEATLRENLAEQQRLYQTILDLPTPIIPLSDSILITPLIGVIDQSRAQQIISSTLYEVSQRHTQILIVDVSGMVMIDSAVAQVLIQIAKAARLLGAQVVLVGIRPEIAQTLITLGIDLETIQTAATLQEGLALAGVLAS